ncbi:MAG: hypothetical protein IKX03_03200, partial [Bacteroidales bacterium]|nr:hypothetical protein [Bacteroidales bacterium]
MSEIGYYHLCSNGRSAGNFIQNEKDLRAAFNIAGVCAANCNVKVVTCVVEETHLHSLQYGSYG